MRPPRRFCTSLSRAPLPAAALSLVLAACSRPGRTDAEGQDAKQPAPSEAEPAATPEAESLPPPPPIELVCGQVINLLAKAAAGTEEERETSRQVCLSNAEQTLAEDPARYLAEGYCTLLSSDARELGRCTEDPRSIPCQRAADRMAALYYQDLEAKEGPSEDAHTSVASIEHDRLLFACLADGFEYASLDCVLEATTHAGLSACAWKGL